MKKILATLCVLTLALVCVFTLPTRAEAETVSSGKCGAELTWTLDDEGVLTISGTGIMASYLDYGADDLSKAPWKSVRDTIKEIVIENGVTSIGECAFRGCTSVTSVTIPSGVTTIGDYAFSICTNLTSVTIPSSVTTIGRAAFSSCSSLTGIWVNAENLNYSSDYKGVLFNKDKTELIQVPIAISGSYTIPDTITSIGSKFASRTSLTELTIPDSVTTIDSAAFENCSSLVAVNIGDGVTSIGDFAFRYCKALTSVNMGDSVTTIGRYAFCECSGLTSVTLGNSIVTIGEYAFYRCTSLTEITIPDNVTTIAFFAFSGCTGLTSVTIGDSVTVIRNEAFNSCTSLTTVVIPGNVEIIGEKAFYQCTGLNTVTIGDGVTEIGKYAFDGCTALNSVVIPGSVNTIGNSAFSQCSKLASITICDGVSAIGQSAFYDCDSLTDLTIGNGVTVIGNSAFNHCENLRVVAIPDSVVTIGNWAFKNCTGLETVTIGNSVTTIGDCAFYRCSSLPSITIPKSVVSIGEGALSVNGLTGIWVDENNTAYSSDKYGVLFNKDKTILIQAPHGNYGGPTHLNSYVVPDGVSVIGKSAFYACRLLNAVTLPVSLTEVQADAFQSCGNLSWVYYPGSQEKWNEVSIATGNDYLLNAIFNPNHIHDYSLVQPVTVDATCTEEGYVEYTCVYGETYREYTPALGHDYTGPVKTVVVTCTEKGVSGPTCTRCNEIRPDQVTDALGHNMIAVKAKEATCTQSGNSFGTQCSRCETYGIQPEIYPALDHSFADYHSNGDATCTTDGTETAKCDRCDMTDTRTVVGSAKGHSHTKKVTKPTCTAKGYTTYTCACGDTYKVNYTNALGHSYKSGSCTRCKYKPTGAKITTQPVNVAVSSGKTAKVTVKATGSGLKYQWYYAKKGSSKYTKDSVTSASYSVKMSSSVNGRKVYCVVTDKYGNTVKSNVVTLYKGTAVKIKTQPKGITVANGKTGKLELKASGTGLKYQWYVKYKGASSFTKVGSSSKTYSFKMASKLDGAQAYCVVKDKYGIEVKSSVVTIKLAPKAKITTQPKNVMVAKGKTAKVTLKATGDGLKYTWYYAKSGSSKFKKASGKSSTYSVKMSASVNGRRVYCVVKDKYGNSVKSNIVTLKMK